MYTLHGSSRNKQMLSRKILISSGCKYLRDFGLRVNRPSARCYIIATRNSNHSTTVLRPIVFSSKKFLSTGPSNKDDGPEKGGNKPPSRIGSIVLSAAAAGTFLIGKTKYLLVALKLTKAAPLVSMMITSVAYSWVFGWPYALGMVGLIFVHETGHALVMTRYGVPFSPMVFIPFVGAVISMKGHPRTAYEEAMIAFGGPVLGSLAAGACALTATAIDSQLLYALAVN